MSLDDLRKWDERYREGAYAERRHPSALLERLIGELGAGTALDVASGAGRNALFLAEHGFKVDAVDISPAGLARLERDARDRNLEVSVQEADLDAGLDESLALQQTYDLIVMIRYVNLPLIGALKLRLADRGVLVCEEHLKTDHAVAGPRNDAFRLEPNALLAAASGLRVHYYREGRVLDPHGSPVALAQLIASRGRTDFSFA